MHSTRANLDTCANARGVAIVIDVIRAFTTATYAFAAGAREIVPVSMLEHARMLGARFPGARLMGAAGGLSVVMVRAVLIMLHAVAVQHYVDCCLYW